MARIDYIELPGTQLAATKAFYEATFGWSFTDFGPEYSGTETGDHSRDQSRTRRSSSRGSRRRHLCPNLWLPRRPTFPLQRPQRERTGSMVHTLVWVWGDKPQRRRAIKLRADCAPSAV
jgi:hypothetical protein